MESPMIMMSYYFKYEKLGVPVQDSVKFLKNLLLQQYLSKFTHIKKTTKSENGILRKVFNSGYCNLSNEINIEPFKLWRLHVTKKYEIEN